MEGADRNLIELLPLSHDPPTLIAYDLLMVERLDELAVRLI